MSGWRLVTRAHGDWQFAKGGSIEAQQFSTHWKRPSKGSEIKEMHHLLHTLASRQASYSIVRLRFADRSPAAMWDPAGSTPRHLYLTYKDRFARWIALSNHRGRGHVSPIFLSVGGTERTDVCTRVILLSLFDFCSFSSYTSLCRFGVSPTRVHFLRTLQLPLAPRIPCLSDWLSLTAPLLCRPEPRRTEFPLASATASVLSPPRTLLYASPPM